MYVKKELSQEYTELYNSPKAAPSAVPVNQEMALPKSSPRRLGNFKSPKRISVMEDRDRSFGIVRTFIRGRCS